jgi:hypothetical protein
MLQKLKGDSGSFALTSVLAGGKLANIGGGYKGISDVIGVFDVKWKKDGSGYDFMVFHTGSYNTKTQEMAPIPFFDGENVVSFMAVGCGFRTDLEGNLLSVDLETMAKELEKVLATGAIVPDGIPNREKKVQKTIKDACFIQGGALKQIWFALFRSKGDVILPYDAWRGAVKESIMKDTQLRVRTLLEEEAHVDPQAANGLKDALALLGQYHDRCKMEDIQNCSKMLDGGEDFAMILRECTLSYTLPTNDYHTYFMFDVSMFVVHIDKTSSDHPELDKTERFAQLREYYAEYEASIVETKFKNDERVHMLAIRNAFHLVDTDNRLEFSFSV